MPHDRFLTRPGFAPQMGGSSWGAGKESSTQKFLVGATLYTLRLQARPAENPRFVPLTKKLDFAHADALSNQRTVEPVGDVFSPHVSTAATPLAHNRDIFVPDGARRGILREQIRHATPKVWTTPFLVDSLKSLSVQAAEDALTLSRNVDQEPPAAPHKNSGAGVKTHRGECVPTLGAQN